METPFEPRRKLKQSAARGRHLKSKVLPLGFPETPKSIRGIREVTTLRREAGRFVQRSSRRSRPLEKAMPNVPIPMNIADMEELQLSLLDEPLDDNLLAFICNLTPLQQEQTAKPDTNIDELAAELDQLDRQIRAEPPKQGQRPMPPLIPIPLDTLVDQEPPKQGQRPMPPLIPLETSVDHDVTLPLDTPQQEQLENESVVPEQPTIPEDCSEEWTPMESSVHDREQPTIPEEQPTIPKEPELEQPTIPQASITELDAREQPNIELEQPTVPQESKQPNIPQEPELEALEQPTIPQESELDPPEQPNIPEELAPSSPAQDHKDLPEDPQESELDAPEQLNIPEELDSEQRLSSPAQGQIALPEDELQVPLAADWQSDEDNFSDSFDSGEEVVPLPLDYSEFPPQIIEFFAHPDRPRKQYPFVWNAKPSNFDQTKTEIQYLFDLLCDFNDLPRCSVQKLTCSGKNKSKDKQKSSRPTSYDRNTNTIGVPFNVHFKRILNLFCCHRTKCQGIEEDHSRCSQFGTSAWGSVKEPNSLMAKVNAARRANKRADPNPKPRRSRRRSNLFRDPRDKSPVRKYGNWNKAVEPSVVVAEERGIVPAELVCDPMDFDSIPLDPSLFDELLPAPPPPEWQPDAKQLPLFGADIAIEEFGDYDQMVDF